MCFTRSLETPVSDAWWCLIIIAACTGEFSLGYRSHWALLKPSRELQSLLWKWTSKFFTCLLSFQTGWGFPPPNGWNSASFMKPSPVIGRGEIDPRLRFPDRPSPPPPHRAHNQPLSALSAHRRLVQCLIVCVCVCVCVCVSVSVCTQAALSPVAMGLWVWDPLCVSTDPVVALTHWTSSWDEVHSVTSCMLLVSMLTS